VSFLRKKRRVFSCKNNNTTKFTESQALFYSDLKLNVSARTLYKWRKGETFPRLDKAFELAKILGVEITELYVIEK